MGVGSEGPFLNQLIELLRSKYAPGELTKLEMSDPQQYYQEVLAAVKETFGEWSALGSLLNWQYCDYLAYEGSEESVIAAVSKSASLLTMSTLEMGLVAGEQHEWLFWLCLSTNQPDLAKTSLQQVIHLTKYTTRKRDFHWPQLHANMCDVVIELADLGESAEALEAISWISSHVGELYNPDHLRTVSVSFLTKATLALTQSKVKPEHKTWTEALAHARRAIKSFNDEDQASEMDFIGRWNLATANLICAQALLAFERKREANVHCQAALAIVQDLMNWWKNVVRTKECNDSLMYRMKARVLKLQTMAKQLESA